MNARSSTWCKPGFPGPGMLAGDRQRPDASPPAQPSLPPAEARPAYRRGMLVLIALLTFVRGVFYLAVIPAWQGPDEPGHFEYVALLARLGRVPKPNPDTETVPELTLAINGSAQAQHIERTQPRLNIQRQNEMSPPALVGPREAGYQTPIYYELLLPFYRLAGSSAILDQYYTLALTSVLLGVVTVLAAAMTIHTLLPANRWAHWVVPLLICFWPTQTFMATRINNDNLVTALAALVFWAATVIIRHGPWRLSSLTLFGLVGLAAATKGTAVFLLPVGLLAFTLALAGRFTGRLRLVLERAVVAAGALAVVLGLMAFWVPRVAQIILSLVRRLPGANRGQEWFVALLSVLAAGQQWQAARLARNGAEMVYILKTFWAVFGWARFFLPAPFYFAAGACALVGLLGWLKLTRPANRQALGWVHWQWQVLVLFAASIPLACVPLAARMLFAPFTGLFHGRILLTVALPVTVLLALGWYQWIPSGWRAPSVAWLLALLILLEAAAFALVLLPVYYGCTPCGA